MQALYQAAGLNLGADLQNLTKHANITPDPAAVSSLEQTSVPTGHLPPHEAGPGRSAAGSDITPER